MSAQAMMRPKFKRSRGFSEMGRRAANDVRKILVARLVMGLTDVQKSIMETPVYTGRTLVNFRWSLHEAVTVTRAPIADPALPGKTSDLPIGGEPRRRANAEIVAQEFQALLASVMANPFQKIYLTNNTPHFYDVEYGTYARARKESRTPPGGMTRRGETLFQYSLMGFIKGV